MILQSLVEYYERKVEVLPPYGFEEKQIPFTIVIDEQGKFIQLEFNADINSDGKSEARSFRVPKASGRQGSKSYEIAYCLWDHYGYVLAQPKIVKPGSEPSKKDVDMANRQHQSFVRLVNKLNQALPNDVGIKAVSSFLASADEIYRVKASELWPECLKVKGCNLTFRLASQTHLVCQSAEVINWISKQPLSEKDVRDGLCLVTGKYAPITRLHEVVAGVNQKPSPLAAINDSAYSSYGKDKGFNFPISAETSFQYATALNHLLRKNSPNKFRVLETSYVCWSEGGSALEEWMPVFMSTDDNTDAGIRAVKGLFDSIHNGAYQPSDGADRFYLLGLAPNSARIMVRFWQVGTVAQFSENIAKWFEDIAIEGVEKFGYPPLKKLLRSTALQYKDDNVPPNLPGAVVKAILNNTPLPNGLMQGVIRRIKAEAAKKNKHTNKPVENVTFVRAGLIKAFINRLPNKGGGITMSLNTEERRTGYCLGRLFAILEKIQQDAQPGINATIKDRYYSSASCTPKSVFGTLLRLSNHHLKKLEQDSWRIAAEKRIGNVMDLIAEFPSHLDLEDQGLFAIGYYHQKQDFYKAKSQQGETV